MQVKICIRTQKNAKCRRKAEKQSDGVAAGELSEYAQKGAEDECGQHCRRKHELYTAVKIPSVQSRRYCGAADEYHGSAVEKLHSAVLRF